MAKRFPAKLFVKIEQDSDNSYFVSGGDLIELAEMGQSIKVGIYQLVETTYAEVVVKTSGTIKK